MKKMIFYVITVVIIISIGVVCLVFADSPDKKNTDFLKKYGWKTTGKYTEAVKIKIPQIFDDVYENYNVLQKNASLDLEQYKGKTAIRYTYIITNFPHDTNGATVYANIICVNNKPVAGDVMTVPIDGFMYSLNYLKTGK